MIGRRERFEQAIASLPGKWTVRERASFGCGANMCATRKVGGGKVEVWGGSHRNEVWYVEGESETCVTTGWTPETLADDVERAAALADGAQTRMAM